MSLDVARTIASNSLMVAEVKISVTSSNISNADTDGYTVKTANQAAVVSGGSGAGTVVTGITSTVDKLLLKSLIQSDSALGAADTNNNYLDQLQSLLGSAGGSDSSGTNLASTLASLESSLSELSGTSSSAALQSNTVSALDAVAAQLRETSDSVQGLRSDADKEINSSVDIINTQLETISSLNSQIKQAAASGQSTADLEDQRNTALQTVASKIGVSYFTSSSGDMQVYTTSGQVLVDSSAHQLSYTAAASVSANTTYSSTGASGFSGLTVNGIDITSQVSSGEVGALLTLRDTTLPAVQSQLDQLATSLADTLNSVSNQGTALPPPESLTGTTAVTSGTSLSGTGTARIAVADSDGNLVSYQDLDLSSYGSVGDLVTAINGISGLSASIDSDGHVLIATTDSGNGVSINEMTSSVDDKGLSDWLGLNDVVSATGASDFKVSSTLLSNSGLLPVSTLDDSTTLTAGNSVLSASSTTVTDNLYSALTGSTSFAAVGGLGSTNGSFADYASSIVSSAASKATAAASTYTAKETAQSTYSNSMASQSGVNLDEETSKLSTLQNEYSAASQLLQTINEMFSSLLDAVKSAG